MGRLMSGRKLCVLTGGRAEYGLLYWLLKEIEQDADLELQIVATGMHLSQEFGLTYRKIEEDGFRISRKIEILMSSDTPVGTAKSMGLGMIGFADAFDVLKPDIVIVLGDRFEIFAAAQAAMVARIPIAHISGGEITEGGIDDAIRHGISKMASFHFVSSEAYRRRVIQLGEHPARVMNCGDPGIENISRMRLMPKDDLLRGLGMNPETSYFLLTYHPETLTGTTQTYSMEELFAALERFKSHSILITKSNADEGGRAINACIDDIHSRQPERVHVFTSLGQLRYLSAMKHCAAVVGNSSSGIVEAPVLRRPTVNIGLRQSGRLMADSIISCANERTSIERAIERALSAEFSRQVNEVMSLYGSGNTASFIKNYLKSVPLDGVMKKFFDVEFEYD